MHINNTREWAEEVFGNCDLGDARRVARLVSYAALQADNPEASTSEACTAKSAEAEGAYRLLRNEAVEILDIDEGAFDSTAAQCDRRELVLAIQDTTTVEVAHEPLWDGLKEKGCPSGFIVHSTLMVDGISGQVIGLGEQERWVRKKNRLGRDSRYERHYEDKESFKWQSSQERLGQRLCKTDHIITVCDREADIYEFLSYQQSNGLRYVVRCSLNRRTKAGGKLWDEMETMPVLGYREVVVEQRGPSKHVVKAPRPSRQKRRTRFEIRAGRAVVLWPKNRKPENAQPLIMNAVYVKEIDVVDGSEPVIWRLLTSEPVENFEQASMVVKYYEKRWLIEEFHKCWKTGCRVEDRPLQTTDSIERFMAISAHIAVRILGIKCMAESSIEENADAMLSEEEWQCLYTCAHPQKKMPKGLPTAKMVYDAIAKLGCFLDTKRTGRAGWKTLWKGWYRFQERLSAWQMAKQFYSSLPQAKM